MGSRAKAQRLIDSGLVTVDGRARLKRHRLSPGERVEARIEAPAAPDDPAAGEGVPYDVVFEDDYLLVVDKPAGLVTHPAPGPRGPTLAEALRGRAAGGPDPERAGIVHRLDRDTSGLLVVTKTEEAHAALLAGSCAPREVRREYLALVAGRPDAESGTIDAPIGRDRARAHGGVHAQRSAAHGGDPLRGDRARCRPPRCCGCGSKPGARTRSARTWPRSATRSAATRSTAAAPAAASSA